MPDPGSFETSFLSLLQTVPEETELGTASEGRKVKASKCSKAKPGLLDAAVRGSRSELLGWRAVKLVLVFVDDFSVSALSGRKPQRALTSRSRASSLGGARSVGLLEPGGVCSLELELGVPAAPTSSVSSAGSSPGLLCGGRAEVPLIAALRGFHHCRHLQPDRSTNLFT